MCVLVIVEDCEPPEGIAVAGKLLFPGRLLVLSRRRSCRGAKKKRLGMFQSSILLQKNMAAHVQTRGAQESEGVAPVHMEQSPGTTSIRTTVGGLWDSSCTTC